MDLRRLDEGAVDGGLHHGGRHGVDPDTVVRQLHRHVLGQGVQPRLGHGIGRRRGRLDGLVGPHGTDMDDGPAAVGRHVLRRLLADEEERPVEGQVGVVVRGRMLQKRFGGEDPGGIHQVVDPLHLLAQVAHEPLHLGRLRQVAAHGGDQAGRRELLPGSGQLLLPPAHQRHPGPRMHQHSGRLQPHAAAAADDQRLFA